MLIPVALRRDPSHAQANSNMVRPRRAEQTDSQTKTNNSNTVSGLNKALLIVVLNLDK